MLNKAVLDALNEQIKHEYFSSYLYLAMSAHCESVNLPGFAKWLRIQSQEELSHALKFFDYINDQGAKVILQPIDRPLAEYKSPLELFKSVLEHEKKISGLIHKLYELALREADYATQILLQWFVNEQVEEEKHASAIVEQLKLVGDASPALLMMDRQLGARGA
jgi:ferritin